MKRQGLARASLGPLMPSAPYRRAVLWQVSMAADNLAALALFAWLDWHQVDCGREADGMIDHQSLRSASLEEGTDA